MVYIDLLWGVFTPLAYLWLEFFYLPKYNDNIGYQNSQSYTNSCQFQLFLIAQNHTYY